MLVSNGKFPTLNNLSCPEGQDYCSGKMVDRYTIVLISCRAYKDLSVSGKWAGCSIIKLYISSNHPLATPLPQIILDSWFLLSNTLNLVIKVSVGRTQVKY
jgi:hypothetical protein